MPSQDEPIVLFIFHRDLRLEDHLALKAAAEFAGKNGASILPCFIFTPEQVSTKNTFRSMHSVQFMITSLLELDEALRHDGTRLQAFYGDVLEVVEQLKRKYKLAAIFETADYTPYAKQRASTLHLVALKDGLHYEAVHDIYLTVPGSTLNGTGRPFQKFTPFWESARRRRVPSPEGKAVPKGLWEAVNHTNLPAICRQILAPAAMSSKLHVKGGRSEGLRLLADLPNRRYNTNHNLADKPTSHLSAHHHYGTVSIRESYEAGRKARATEFVRQLYWRDFYGQICDSFELLYGESAYEFTGKGPWRSDAAARSKFQRWAEGRTGKPIVDAGIKQLLATGFMHNRVRLVVASYLIKDLKVYWRWGEKFFAQHLVDYDFAQNFGNWCWVASVLPFSQPPFRRFDPERTAEVIDPNGVYRETWLGSDATQSEKN
jgi:deoxyribodipyrimidine photo-lyase